MSLASGRDVADAVAQGRISSVEVTQQALARIRDRDPVLQAWACVDEEGALQQARRLDAGAARGPLHGVPIGIKDIIDTHDLPTAYGSPIYEGYRPRRDASVVALLRRAGAVIIGKTVTTEFALFTAGATTNPHDPGHTPGGSSSGSAAAVADGMVPWSVGTQTGGSLIRPAAYCGVVGFKPSFGTVSRSGVLTLSDVLDTIGSMATTVSDAALIAAVMSDRPFLANYERDPGPPRFGICQTEYWESAEPATRIAMDDVVALVESAAGTARVCELSSAFSGLMTDQRTILHFDLRQNVAFEREFHVAQLSPRLRGMLEVADGLDVADRAAALQRAARARAALDEVFSDVDVLLTPSAPGFAPAGLESTGTSIFNSSWTLLGCPCVTIPVPSDGTLPVGVQLVGRPGHDAGVLAAAEWLEHRLAP